MDDEGDLECTCDVGPFAACPLHPQTTRLSPGWLDKERKEREYFRKQQAKTRGPSMLEMWNYARGTK